MYENQEDCFFEENKENILAVIEKIRYNGGVYQDLTIFNGNNCDKKYVLCREFFSRLIEDNDGTSFCYQEFYKRIEKISRKRILG